MSAEFPVTNIGLANALLAAHNAAMTAGHERSYNGAAATPIDIACIISTAFAAVAEQLATSAEAYPQTVCPIPQTPDMATAMHLVGTEAMKRLAPERLRSDMVTVPRIEIAETLLWLHSALLRNTWADNAEQAKLAQEAYDRLNLFVQE